MRSTSLVFGAFLLAFAAIGCGSDSAPAGGTGGSGGGGGGGTGGMDAGTAFMAVPPCNAQTDYVTGSMVTFAMSQVTYTPKCLKVSKGSMVTFKADTGSTFMEHPLKPSTKRGDKTGNPIMITMDGTTATFTFSTAGYFAYFCGNHGFSDTGSAGMMDGVVWVTP